MSDIVFPGAEEYIRQTVEKSSPFLRYLEEYAREYHVPIIKKETKCLLSVLCHIHKPKQVLEVGCAIGYSTIAMAESLPDDAFITTIERESAMTDLALSHIHKAGYQDRIRVLEGDAGEILPMLTASYDMIFLDAAKGYYLSFLPECMRLLKTGGVLISDNVLYRGMIAEDERVVRRQRTIVFRMREYLDRICKTDGLKSAVIPIGDGVAITYKQKQQIDL